MQNQLLKLQLQSSICTDSKGEWSAVFPNRLFTNRINSNCLNVAHDSTRPAKRPNLTCSRGLRRFVVLADCQSQGLLADVEVTFLNKGHLDNHYNSHLGVNEQVRLVNSDESGKSTQISQISQLRLFR